MKRFRKLINENPWCTIMACFLSIVSFAVGGLDSLLYTLSGLALGCLAGALWRNKK